MSRTSEIIFLVILIIVSFAAVSIISWVLPGHYYFGLWAVIGSIAMRHAINSRPKKP